MLFALLGLMLATLLCINTALLIVPVFIGRLIFLAVGVSARHDFYSAAAGVYCIWGASLLSWQAYKVAGTGSASAAVHTVWQWAKISTRIGAMAVLGIALLPTLIGLNMELLLMPLRLKREETPSFFIYQDWALGLLFLKMGLRGLDNLFPALPRPQEDAQYEMPCLQPLKLLCARYRLLIAAGLSQVTFLEAWSVLWPPLKFFGALACVPYVVSRGLLPRLPYVREEMLHAAFTFAWSTAVLGVIFWLAAAKAGMWLRRYRAKVRDQQYMIHRELMNLEGVPPTVA